jgi:ATP/maltotriose-dependent transcriptional regulator MalT
VKPVRPNAVSPTNFAAFDGNVIRALAAEFLALAKQQLATLPLMTAHRLMGVSAAYTGAIPEGRAYYNEALALYDPDEHRSLAGRFSTDTRATVLSFRSQALWLLGHPDHALTDASNALEQAREIGHAATLMVTLTLTSICYLHIGDYAAASALSDELVGLAHEKDAPIWKGFGMLRQGQALAMTGQTFHAVERIVDGLSEFRSTKATLMMPWCVSYLAEAHAELRQFDKAWRRIDEAMSVMEASNERWAEPEINRMAGEIALMSPERDAAKAESYFERSRCGSSTGGQILGTTRSDEPGAALA